MDKLSFSMSTLPLKTNEPPSIKSGSIMNQQFYCFGENWDINKDAPVAFIFGVLPWKRKYLTAQLSEYRTAYRFGNHKI